MVSTDDLTACELFGGLTSAELEEIAAIAHKRTYQAGELICVEQDRADRLFILDEGRVQLNIHLRSSLEPDGEVTIEEVEPGCVFGWSSLVKQRRFTASARAVEPVTVIVVGGDELNDLFDRNAHIGFVVVKQLAEVIASRLQHTRAVCHEWGSEDTEEG